MVTDEQREQAYIASNATQKKLYDLPSSGEKLHAIYTNHKLTDSKITFLVAIGDVILGLVPQEKLPSLLIERLQIGQSDAMRITADVLDFLAPLSGVAAAPRAQAPVTTSYPPAPSPQAAPAPAPTYVPDDIDALRQQLANAEANLRTTPAQPAPAMAQNVEPAQGYVAPQPLIPTVPEPSELIHQSIGQDSLLADGPGQQLKNPDATWNTTT